MRATFSSAQISDVIGVIPSSFSSFDDEIANYTHDTSSSLKLKEVMGYGIHHIAPSHVTTADLAVAGFNELVARDLIRSSEIDALFFVSQTPDFIIPPTSCVLHGKFELPADCYCVDINDGCNGYIKGLFEAFSFMESTSASCILLIAGDVLSPIVSRRDRNSFPLVGDAATLTVLRRSPRLNNDHCVHFEIQTDGSSFDKLIVPAGGARQRLSGKVCEEQDADGNWRSPSQLCMNGRDVFAFTQTRVPDFLISFCASLGREPHDYDRIFAHQANSFIIDRLRKKLKVTNYQMPDRVVRQYGNSSSATIPMLIASEPDSGLMLDCLLCGFGVGLSWGAASLFLAPSSSKGIIEFS